jgi:hypothetical protein
VRKRTVFCFDQGENLEENKGEKVGRSLLVKEQGRLMATAK